jgi:hypothetical protein
VPRLRTGTDSPLSSVLFLPAKAGIVKEKIPPVSPSPSGIPHSAFPIPHCVHFPVSPFQVLRSLSSARCLLPAVLRFLRSLFSASCPLPAAPCPQFSVPVPRASPGEVIALDTPAGAS